MDEKYIFLLIMNKDNIENLYRHLVEMKKPSPPPRPPQLNPPSQWKYYKEADTGLKFKPLCNIRIYALFRHKNLSFYKVGYKVPVIPKLDARRLQSS